MLRVLPVLIFWIAVANVGAFAQMPAKNVRIGSSFVAWMSGAESRYVVKLW